MLKNLSLAVVVAAACLTATAAQAGVLATCHGSIGQARYDGESGWTPDSISQGTLTFVIDDKGNPNILFKDATGRVVDASADGAEIHVTFTQPALGQFGFVAIYEDDGLVETYNVFTSSDGKRALYWTSNKANTLRPAKVAAFSSTCA